MVESSIHPSGIRVAGPALLQKTARPFILLAWIIACIALAASSSVNINRANIAIIPMIFCAAIGLSFFRKNPFVIWPVFALYAVSFAQFTYAYFGVYREQAASAFFSSLDQALQEAADNTDEAICVTGHVNMPYIFALFYNREDPRIFYQTVDYYNPGAEFQDARSFGRYTFGLESCTGYSYGAYVIHRDERERFTDDRFLLHDDDQYSVAYPLQ